MYIHRTLERFFETASRQFPVLLVTGLRQVGKTTFLMHQKDEGRTLVTLDDPMVRSLAAEDPALFMQRYQPPLLIDEIQYAPQLLPFIKMSVDRNRRPGAFWLTGSQQFHLMKGVSESLAGRVGVINLLGFSLKEQLNRGEQVVPFSPARVDLVDPSPHQPLTLHDLYKIIWRGSFPALLVNGEMDRDFFFNSYVQTYLQRDIRDMTKIANEMSFLRFMRAAAARTGALLNLAELARDADVSQNTAKSWLSLLQTSGVIYLLEPYFANVSKRLLKRPKLYFLDTGLAAYLTEWNSPQTLEAGAMSGHIFETWVIAEILKSYWHNGRRAPLYYYRDKDQYEIDLLIVENGLVHPVEIRKTASPTKSAVKHFAMLKKLNLPVGPGAVICLTETPLPLTEQVSAIPAWML